MAAWACLGACRSVRSIPEAAAGMGKMVHGDSRNNRAVVSGTLPPEGVVDTAEAAGVPEGMLGMLEVQAMLASPLRFLVLRKRHLRQLLMLRVWERPGVRLG